MNVDFAPIFSSFGLTRLYCLQGNSRTFCLPVAQNCSLVTTLKQDLPVMAHLFCRPEHCGPTYAVAGQPLTRCASVLFVQPCALREQAKGQCGEQGAKVIAVALGLKCYRFEWCRAEVHCFILALDWTAVTPLYCLVGKECIS